MSWGNTQGLGFFRANSFTQMWVVFPSAFPKTIQKNPSRCEGGHDYHFTRNFAQCLLTTTPPSAQTRLMCHLTRACLCLLTLLLPFILTSRDPRRHHFVWGRKAQRYLWHRWERPNTTSWEGEISSTAGQAQGQSWAGMVAHGL